MTSHSATVIPRWESWLWSIAFGVTSLVALLPTTILVSEILRHRSVMFLNVISSQGLEKPLAQEVSRNWGEVKPEYVPAWFLHRTPTTLYLATLITGWGSACCMAALRHWHRELWFVLLMGATLIAACFHLWAQSPWENVSISSALPMILFPAFVLSPLWMFTRNVERHQRRTANEPIRMNGTHAR